MNKTIIIDYKEYLELEEKANMTQSKMDKKFKKLHEEMNEKVRVEMKRQHYNIENDYKYYKRTFTETLESKLLKKTNIFNYVSIKNILEAIKETNEEME